MKPKRREIIENIFNEAVLLSPAEQKKFLASACGSDAELHKELDILLTEDQISKKDKFPGNEVFSYGIKLHDYNSEELRENTDFASYKIIKLIGRGGMGAVYLAEDLRLERLVALKVLPSDVGENQQSMLRFRQEAKAASAISHPNVAHIYEFDKSDSRYYLAMEYIEGKTLRELLKEKTIDLKQALDFACQIANALSAAHKRGFVHRDIKPENIVITTDGVIKVLDFGLAKLFAPENILPEKRNFTESFNSSPGMIIGTTAYMSPEQTRGREVDARADLWSLSVILYEMLVGKRPFEGETPSDTQAEVLLKDYPSLPENIVKILPGCQRVLDKGLAKDTSARYQSGAEFVEDLEELETELKEFKVKGKIIERQKDNDFKRNVQLFLNKPLENFKAKELIFSRFIKTLLLLLALTAVGFLAYYFIFNKK